MKDLQNMPSLNALKAFVAVAETGSINAASQLLHVTHGAVSRQIKLLEDELGLALLEKHGRGIKLTHSGRVLARDAGSALQQIANSCQQLKQEQTQQPLVLACSGSLLARWLIPRLPSLQQALPDLPLQLVTSADDERPQQQADLSLSFMEQPQASELLIKLEQERIGPVLAPQLAEQLDIQAPPGQILSSQRLLHTLSRPQAWPDWAQHNGISTDTLKMGQGFPHLSYLLEATLAGLGIGIAPEQLIRNDLQQGSLLAPWGFVNTEAWLCLQVHSKNRLQRIQPLANKLLQLVDNH